MVISKFMLPVMLTLAMLSAVSVAEGIGRSTSGYDLLAQNQIVAAR